MKTGIDIARDTLVVKRRVLTAAQLANRAYVCNPYDLVYRLRREGYPIIYAAGNTKEDGKYFYGMPSSEAIAAAHANLGAREAFME